MATRNQLRTAGGYYNSPWGDPSGSLSNAAHAEPKGGATSVSDPGAVQRMFSWASQSDDPNTTVYNPGGTAASAGGGGGGFSLDADAAAQSALVQHGTAKVPAASPENQDLLAQMFPKGAARGGRPASTTATGGHVSSGSGQQAQLVPTSKTSTTTQSWQPSGPRPELAAGPEYVAPEYDEDEVRRLAGRIAAPALMRQRRDMMTAISQSGRYFGNPIARAEATRRALRAYGLGAAETLSRSESAGRAQYQQQYQTDVNEAMTNWQAGQQRNLTNFQAAMQEFMQSGERVSNTESTTQYKRVSPDRRTMSDLNTGTAGSGRTTGMRMVGKRPPAGGYRSGSPGGPQPVWIR
jgi:hypothetical protein